MAIRPVEFSGVVQRSQDRSTLKQNEDNKPVFQQQVLVTKMEKETQQQLKQVNHGEDAENYQKKYDAREKGSNEYQRQRKEGKKKAGKKDGKAVSKPLAGGFDIKI